jgi:PPM family protein phosphatase
MRISAAGLSDVGLQRDHNEDTFRCLDEYHLYVVADGMGGHNSGEVASAMAVEGMKAFFEATEKEDATWPFKMANKQIYDRSSSDAATQGMGTTLVAILVAPDRSVAHVAHVGDSRAYRIRGGKAELLTRDHSLVNDYLMMMPDMPKEAMDILPRNVITRALGMQDSVVVDLGTEDVRAGDRFVLCSDGLSGQVSDEDIAKMVTESGSDMSACLKKLVTASNDAGGEDNVTVVVIAIEP